MTPDDMEAVGRAILHLEGIAVRNEASENIIHQTIAKSIRALLKAYQEQRRALEAASPVVPVGVSRETLARIIEPYFFSIGRAGPDYEPHRASAFRKADAILAALTGETS